MTDATCSVPACERPVDARGYCNAHYLWSRANGWEVPSHAIRHKATVREPAVRLAQSRAWKESHRAQQSEYGRLRRIARGGSGVPRIGNPTHGMSRLPEYRIWKGMKSRVTSPSNHAWADYGGRGIRMCAEWLADFPAFYAYMGPRPSTEYSIDRIDNDGNYEPGNVRWADAKTQRANRRK